MLKLPKGLKKKKKSKKSKKDQELFTEEELEAYKKQLQQKQEQQQQQQELENQTQVEETNSGAVEVDTNQEQPTTTATANNTKKETDEEWSKFAALTAGVDQILHKTQDDLDRIKSTSFFKRVPPPSEVKQKEEEEEEQKELAAKAEENQTKDETETVLEKLKGAVVELSESEDESEDSDDIFETNYIDAITSGEIQLAVVPDSPILEDDGDDPFDTSYADKLIKGPEVSKRGKKIVNIGAAVEVLTGKLDNSPIPVGGVKRKPRRGIQNLLLDDFDNETVEVPEVTPIAEAPKTLLDEGDDDILDIPIDLSVSLHLTLQKEKKESESLEGKTEETQQEEKPNIDIVKEFLDEEDDEFALLAAESLSKKEEVIVIKQPAAQILNTEVEGNWAEFASTKDEEQLPFEGNAQLSQNLAEDIDEDFVCEDDPFDTTFVDTFVPKTETAEQNFQLKVNEEKDLFGGSNTDLRQIGDDSNLLLVKQNDLLSQSTSDLSALAEVLSTTTNDQLDIDNIDPFDTSTITDLVKPKETELKLLEKELLESSGLKHSLSDPDFDPRAEEPETTIKFNEPEIDYTDKTFLISRKSSLTLNLPSKSVGFKVSDKDTLNPSAKIQKVPTPYYNTKSDEKIFDNPAASTNLKKSLSDPDFDPRAGESPVQETKNQSDLLVVEDQLNIKVLTPAQSNNVIVEEIDLTFDDPFDTSAVAANILPGKTELKLLENELLPETEISVKIDVLDTQSDAQELGLGDKVLTPKAPSIDLESPKEIDPFDTTFAENLEPGQIEIKVLEKELI